MDRKPLSLRCDPEQYSTLLWPPAMCNHSCIRQELACYSEVAELKQDYNFHILKVDLESVKLG